MKSMIDTIVKSVVVSVVIVLAFAAIGSAVFLISFVTGSDLAVAFMIYVVLLAAILAFFAGASKIRGG